MLPLAVLLGFTACSLAVEEQRTVACPVLEKVLQSGWRRHADTASKLSASIAAENERAALDCQQLTLTRRMPEKNKNMFVHHPLRFVLYIMLDGEMVLLTLANVLGACYWLGPPV